MRSIDYSEQQRRSDESQRTAQTECRGRAEYRPDEPEEQTRGQRAEPGNRVIHAEREAKALGGGTAKNAEVVVGGGTNVDQVDDALALVRREATEAVSRAAV